MTENRKSPVDLYARMEAYWLYLQGYDLHICAMAAGVSERTVRKWAQDEGWKKDVEWCRGMARALALAEAMRHFLEREKKNPLSTNYPRSYE